MLLRALVVSLLAILVAPRDAGAAWRWPVRGEVLTPFVFAGGPFAAGQHRGIDIAARAGAAVRAPCGGIVRFAGRVPGRGRGVTIRCGRLVATVLELGRVFVAKGEHAVARESLGTVAASHIQLGARRAGQRHGYIDPRTLLRGDTIAPPPLVGPPSGRVERPRVWPVGPRPAFARATATADEDRARDGRLPAVAWAGLAFLAAGTPVGLWRRRRGGSVRRSAARAIAARR